MVDFIQFFFVQATFSIFTSWLLKFYKMSSVFKQVTAKFYVDLYQYYIGDLKKAAKLEISSRILKYDPDLDGVILGFSNVESLPKDRAIKTCFCYADSPFVHIRMQATFLVFKPYPTCQLPAAVTFISSSAISLTIFDYFQGYVDLNQHREDWSFRAERWAKKKNESESFGQNDFVIVEVTDVCPNNDGYVLNVKIISKSDIPPIEPIEADAIEDIQDENVE